jgi:hypothetical protein
MVALGSIGHSFSHNKIAKKTKPAISNRLLPSFQKQLTAG